MARAAKNIGKALAYIQDTADIAVRYVFFRLKHQKLAEEKPQKKFQRATGKVLGFFGEVGDSFYEEYEELKTKRSKK